MSLDGKYLSIFTNIYLFKYGSGKYICRQALQYAKAPSRWGGEESDRLCGLALTPSDEYSVVPVLSRDETPLRENPRNLSGPPSLNLVQKRKSNVSMGGVCKSVGHFTHTGVVGLVLTQ